MRPAPESDKARPDLRLLVVAVAVAFLLSGDATERAAHSDAVTSASYLWTAPSPADGEVVDTDAVTLRASASNDAAAFFDFDGTLAAYWPFENGGLDVAFDESPNDHTAEYRGTLTSASIDLGRFGGGLRLNGQSDYLFTPNGPAIAVAGSELTLSAWVQPLFDGNSGAVHPLYDKSDGAVTSYALVFDGSIGAWRFTLSTTAGTASCEVAHNIVPGVWHHVAARYDGAVMDVFIDGVAAGSLAHTGDVVANAAALRMGGNGTSGFQGIIDEMVVFGRSLGDNEIAYLAGDVAGGVAVTFGGLEPGRHEHGLYYVEKAGNLLVSLRDFVYDPTPLSLTLSRSVFPASRTCRKPTFVADQCPDPEYATFTLSYRIGDYTTLAAGSSLRLITAYPFNGTYLTSYRFNFHFGWMPPQVVDPGAPNFVTAKVSDNPLGNARAYVIGLDPDRGALVRFLDTVGPGSLIEVTYGDPSLGSPGYVVPPIAYDIPLVVEQDANGDDTYALVNAEMPVLSVVGEHLDTFKVVAPSMSADGVIRVTVQALQGEEKKQSNMYLVPGYQGTISFSSTDPAAELPADYTFAPEDEGVHTFDARLMTPGVHHVFVTETDANGASGTSNPIAVNLALEDGPGDIARETRGLYWGTLHQHTNGGGHAAQTPEFAYDYGRRVSALDFLAVSEHCASSAVEWSYTRRLAEENYVPGEFVTFPAIEWTARHFGHRHLLYLDPQAMPSCERFNATMNLASTLRALYEQTENQDVLIILHHFAWRLEEDLDEPVAPNVEVGDIDNGKQRLFEIYSHHGSSERYDNDPYPIHDDPTRQSQWPPSKRVYFQDIIERGYRFGVTADGDNHTGQPGGHVTSARAEGLFEYYARMGLTAVYADDLTREGLWEAFNARRTYGTTGARIILSFRMNGHDMGEEFQTDEAPSARIEVIGTAEIAKIEIFRNGKQVVFTTNPDGSSAELEFIDGDVNHGETYSYYVRVRQVDDHFAWSSPIWIDYSGETRTTLPLQAALRQNAPNPFNPTTLISYDVPVGGGQVSLRVYDVSGRLVRTLVNGFEAPGSKGAEWDGTDNLGRKVASGIYFYKLTVGGFVESKKMVLMK